MNSLPRLVPWNTSSDPAYHFASSILPTGDHFALMHASGYSSTQKLNGVQREPSDTTIDMVNRVHELNRTQGREVFFSPASFVNKIGETRSVLNIRDPSANKWKADRENVAYRRSFALDIDVGKGKGYATTSAALDAVKRFSDVTGLVPNKVVRSGGDSEDSGLHIHWIMYDDLENDEWQRIADKLCAATKEKSIEILADHGVTVNMVVVLRLPGTYNRKPKYKTPRLITCESMRSDTYALDEFEAGLECALELGMSRTTGAGVGGQPHGVLGHAVSPVGACPNWYAVLEPTLKRTMRRSLLAALPKTDVADRGAWLSVGWALAGDAPLPSPERDERFQEWERWSKSTPEGEALWNKDAMTSEDHRRKFDEGKRSGIGSLIVRAASAGWSRKALHDGSEEGEKAYAALSEAHEAIGERWTLAEAEAYMHEHVIYVRADNTYFLDGLPLTKEALDTSLARRLPISERQVTASGLVRKGAGLIVDHLGYKPGAECTYKDRNGRTIANTWREHQIVPMKPSTEDAKSFADFMMHLANGDEETKAGIKRFCTKCAYLHKHPAARIRHATVLIGKNEGCGKSTLTYDIPAALFGVANIRSVETRELSSDFNGYVFGARILVLPELWIGNRKDALMQANNLKPLITDDHIPLVQKGKDGRDIENVTTIFASSNHADAAIFGERDRRYDVIFTSAPAMPVELVKRVRRLIEQRAGSLLWLVQTLSKDTDSFDPNAPPPQTAAKKSMMESGRGVWAQRMRDAFEAREWPFTGDVVAVSDVKRLLEREGGQLPSDNAIRAELLDMADGAHSVQAQRRRGHKTEQARMIVLRNISIWKDAGPSALYDHYAEFVLGGEHGIRDAENASKR